MYRLRAEKFAMYIITNNATIRDTAKYFMYSKSTIHNDVSNRLKKYNYDLYVRVKEIMKNNFNEKHIRGGNSTKLKYEKKQRN